MVNFWKSQIEFDDSSFVLNARSCSGSKHVSPFARYPDNFLLYDLIKSLKTHVIAERHCSTFTGDSHDPEHLTGSPSISLTTIPDESSRIVPASSVLHFK
jgi:hypothetical protein